MSETPHLSYSIAAELITKSPQHAWLKKFGPKDPPSAQQIKGTAIHALLLGVSAGSDVVMIDAENFRTKAAQEKRDAALAEGKTPITMTQMMELTTAADEIRANLEAHGIQLDGQSEVPLEWGETSRYGTLVPCRGKVDHIKGSTIFDLKSSSSAAPEFISRQIYAMGYDIQFAAYSSGFRKAHPKLAGRDKFVFVFFEIEPPYSVTPVTLDGQYRQIGEQRWQRAVDTWAECVSSGYWPHYTTREVMVSAPTWVIQREDNIYDREFEEQQREAAR